MNHVILRYPEKSMEEAALGYRQSFFDRGEMIMSGSNLFDSIASYADWLAHIGDNADPATFFAFHDGRIVGMIDIRLELGTKDLRKYFGHIGYCVHPLERRKGYATQMLRLALTYCGEHGMRKVSLSCESRNTASRKTIEHCGGIFERERPYADGSFMIKQFTIPIK